MINPAYIHPDLAAKLPDMQLVEACYLGERYVRQYLVNPSPESETDSIARQRFDDYKARANFYNATRKTAKSLVGLVFSKYPIVQASPAINTDDINGAGVTLIQQARRALLQCLLKGRCGLLADYPITDGVKTKAELAVLQLKPAVTLYQAEQIINWRVTNRRLSLVVLRESYVSKDDGFEATVSDQLLVLRLENGVATAEIFRDENLSWVSQGVNVLKDSNGKPFTELPFTFIGSDNNDADIDDSPLYDLASVNIAHYRNSADYEESVFIAGQPTLFIAGVTDDWQEHYEDNPIVLGVRTAHLLGVGSTVDMLQAQPNTMTYEAMTHKEQQMIALGAKLIEPNSSTKTATEATGDIVDSTSVLSTLANNVSDAYTKALNWCARFAGEPEQCVVTLNTNFTSNKMTPQERAQLVAEWQSGVITWSEMRAKLVEDDIATIEDPDDAKEQIEANMGNTLELA